MRLGSVARRGVAAFISLGLLLAACGDSGGDGGQADSGDTYLLGFIASFSGNGAVFLDDNYQSVQLAVDEINEQKILDKPIELVTADDASDPQKSQTACTRLVHDQGVAGVIAWQNSANREPCLPIAGEAGIPYLYDTPYEGLECAPNFFVDGAVPNQQVTPLIQYAVEELGSQKWFLYGSDYVAPRGGFEFAKGDIADAGGEIVGEEYAPFDTPDFATPISKILRSGADTLLQGLIGDDYIAFLKQWQETPGTEEIPIVSYTVPFGATEEATGVVVTSPYYWTLETPENNAYKAALEEKFGDDLRAPTDYGVYGYNAVWMWALAVKEAGTADGAAVIEALHNVEFEGPNGLVAFNEQGHATLPMMVGVNQGDGSYEVVKTYPPVEPTDQDDGDCSQ